MEELDLQLVLKFQRIMVKLRDAMKDPKMAQTVDYFLCQVDCEVDYLERKLVEAAKQEIAA